MGENIKWLITFGSGVAVGAVGMLVFVVQCRRAQRVIDRVAGIEPPRLLNEYQENYRSNLLDQHPSNVRVLKPPTSAEELH